MTIVKSIYQTKINVTDFFKVVLEKYLNSVGFEATIWILGLFYLIVVNNPVKSHFSICPLSNLGFDFCPGCGLGNSISYFFKGDFLLSFNSHPLGILAIVILTFRIFIIIKNNRRKDA